VDNITGTSGNDIIIADNTVSSQLTAADQINGGAGTDTLKIYQPSSTSVASTVVYHPFCKFTPALWLGGLLDPRPRRGALRSGAQKLAARS